MSPQKSHDQLEAEKQVAAQAAMYWVRSGMTLGLGTGTTAQYFIGILGEHVRSGRLAVEAVVSSTESEKAARLGGIPVIAPKRGVVLDLVVDGADEIAPDLNLIKGGGGALLREKALSEATRYFLVIGDSSKRVARLGAFPLPIEVVPFTAPWVMDRIEELGGSAVLRRGASSEPFETDQRNYILDCRFGEITEPRNLAGRLKEIPGLVEHGIFLNDSVTGRTMAAVVAEGDEASVLRPGVAPVRFRDFAAPGRPDK